ncbi:class I SAM-dependent methyltransferase [Paraburkholderia hospita]|uniref:class I SAM-dependent methyltransferase n=1 Tax=Paraburkholderia hospita TaxID=169430 RepID=UPI000B341E1C|nr:class I SAM-dependent methyltransferase [Paraburkholderia hospita]OUL88681.1 SAM-dependent methyltransferase [Paraburkholderia hospita]
MTTEKSSLLDEVAEYYSAKLAQHGETAQGVDWNGEKSQILRFEQLEKILNPGDAFSVNDLGCGYGAFYEFLRKRHKNFNYCGIDVADSMIEAAQRRYPDRQQSQFVVASEPPAPADYSVASGIFNVRLDRSEHEWSAYLNSTLDVLDRDSRLGFAFNCLTSYSDADKKRDYLYYSDPCTIFDLCKRRYSRNVALVHDYGLYEFTILVRKIL